MDGFGLKVELKIEGVEDEELIKAAHEVFCFITIIIWLLTAILPVLPLQQGNKAWY